MPRRPPAATDMLHTDLAVIVCLAYVMVLFGVAFAGGWALAVLFGLDTVTSHVLQGILFVIGLYVMYIFLRHAQTVEPFVRRG